MSTEKSELTIELKKTVSATPQEVFKAWTEPEIMKKWFAPSHEYDVPSLDVDLKVGGAFHVEMKTNEASYRVNGKYKQIQKDEHISFSWAWESAPDQESIVTVELKNNNGNTDISLIHKGLKTPESVVEHKNGWQGCLNRLAQLFDAQETQKAA